MNEYIWLGLDTITELLCYWSVYVFVLKAGIHKKWYRYPIFIVSVLTVQLGLYYCLHNITLTNLITIISGIAIPMVLLQKRSKILFFSYLIITLILPIVTSLVDMVLYMSVDKSVLDTDSFNLWALLSNIIFVIVCMILGRIKVSYKNISINFKFTKVQYITLVIGIFCCIILIAYNQLQVSQRGVNTFGNFAISFAGIFICIVMLIISLIQGVLMSKNAKYKEEQLQYDYFLKLQEQNINALLGRDEQLRKFRHDMYGHMTAIRAIAQESNNKELLSYVEKIVSESAVFKVERYTGNVTVDAIISDMRRSMYEKDIVFDYEFNVCIVGDINSYDMCTIIYNIMKNAIEACEKLEVSERYIHMNMHNMEDRVCISLVNSCNMQSNVDMVELDTTKLDTQNHGIGTKNIKEAVMKNGGVVKFSIKAGKFEVNIVL